MASITLDRIWSSGDTPSAWGQFTRRLLVLARARRFARIREARTWLTHSEVRDPRSYADIGVDFERHNRQWLYEMVRAMGGRP